MRKANCNTCRAVYKQLSEIPLGEYERRVAVDAMRDAEAIADAVVWVRDKIVSLNAVLPKLGFKTRSPA